MSKSKNQNSNQILSSINTNDEWIDKLISENRKQLENIKKERSQLITNQNDTDLNKLIDTINKNRSKENLSTFNKSNINLSFKRNEVDKFTQSKKMHSDFSVDINFEIFGKDTV